MTGPTIANIDEPANWNRPDLFQAELPGGSRPHRVRYWIGVGDPAEHKHQLADHIEHGDVVVGIECLHLRDDGQWCGGYISWPNDYGVAPTGHTLVSINPLTVTPSLACRSCPSHGFITDGRWVGAPD